MGVLAVTLLCVCALPGKAAPKITHTIYCVGWDVKPYTLTYPLALALWQTIIILCSCRLQVVAWCSSNAFHSINEVIVRRACDG